MQNSVRSGKIDYRESCKRVVIPPPSWFHLGAGDARPELVGEPDAWPELGSRAMILATLHRQRVTDQLHCFHVWRMSCSCLCACYPNRKRASARLQSRMFTPRLKYPCNLNILWERLKSSIINQFANNFTSNKYVYSGSGMTFCKQISPWLGPHGILP
jgi:hypothetical protein